MNSQQVNSNYTLNDLSLEQSNGELQKERPFAPSVCNLGRVRFIPTVSFGFAEEQGLRGSMEDGCLAVQNFLPGVSGSWFFGVYDGHGGTECVHYLLENLHFTIADSVGAAVQRGLGSFADYESIGVSIRQAFRQTDEEFRFTCQPSGATACVCLLLPDSFGRVLLYCAHLGDSRAVLAHSIGEYMRLTASSDHKATEFAESRAVVFRGGVITNRRVGGCLALTRAFGDCALKQPSESCFGLFDMVSNSADVSFVILNNKLKKSDLSSKNCTTYDIHKRDQKLEIKEINPDFLILACDGLWDVFKDGEAVNYVYVLISILNGKYPDMPSNLAAEIIAQTLVSEALKKGTSDNVTVLVVFLRNMSV